MISRASVRTDFWTIREGSKVFDASPQLVVRKRSRRTQRTYKYSLTTGTKKRLLSYPFSKVGEITSTTTSNKEHSLKVVYLLTC